MEWCEGTMPLGDFLIGGRNKKLGAHQRYFPGDWKPSICRARLDVSLSGFPCWKIHNI